MAASTVLVRNIRACRAEALCEGGCSAVTFNASRFNDLASRSIFPRNEPPNPAKYFSERPQMTSHDGESKKAKIKKEISL
jgi:hypothetical protein